MKLRSFNDLLPFPLSMRIARERGKSLDSSEDLWEDNNAIPTKGEGRFVCPLGTAHKVLLFWLVSPNATPAAISSAVSVSAANDLYRFPDR